MIDAIENIAKQLAWQYFAAWNMNHGKDANAVWAQMTQPNRAAFLRQAQWVYSMMQR